MADEEDVVDEIEVICIEEQRIIMLTGEIDERKTQQFLKSLMLLSQQDPVKHITVYISTYGGDMYEMNAMYDSMRLVKCPIHTIGIGKVMSAGVLLLAAGDRRSLTENTSVMMHQVSAEVYGTVNDVSIEVKHTKALQDSMYKLYSKYTGRPIKQLEQDLKSDKYLTAQEALDYGIVDEILSYAAPLAKIRKRRRK
jgi:ATP-dependent Clp protease protease subunit